MDSRTESSTVSGAVGKSADAGQTNGTSSAAPFRAQAAMVVVPPRQEDLQQSYAQIVDPNANPDNWYGSMINAFGTCMGTLGAVPCCICCPNPYKQVHQGNVGLVTKFGKFYKAVDPGLVKINPLSERIIQVDVKIQIVGMSQPIYLCLVANPPILHLFVNWS